MEVRSCKSRIAFTVLVGFGLPRLLLVQLYGFGRRGSPGTADSPIGVGDPHRIFRLFLLSFSLSHTLGPYTLIR